MHTEANADATTPITFHWFSRGSAGWVGKARTGHTAQMYRTWSEYEWRTSYPDGTFHDASFAATQDLARRDAHLALTQMLSQVDAS